MRKWNSGGVFLPAVLLLSSCGQDEKAEKGVDTTLPENPAKIMGSLSFPSDYLPSDLKVCAENSESKKQYCQAQIADGAYTLEVPAGSYRVFAQTAEMPGRRAYYSEFVKCGYNSWCESHAPIEVTLEEGEEQAGIDPGDWYAQEDVGQANAPIDTEDAAGYDPESGQGSTDEFNEAQPEPVPSVPMRSLVGNLNALFSPDDYPQSAIDANEQGSVGYRLVVGPSGRVTTCTVTMSSGSNSLDRATCRILQSRARFTAPPGGTGVTDGRANWQLQ